MNLSTKR